MDDFNQIKQNLISRLEKQGIEPNIIPGFIRSLANAISVNPQMNLLQVNKHLHFLGWDEFELDYHTLQLAIACFEAEGLKSSEHDQSDVLRSVINRTNFKTAYTARREG